MAEGSGEGPRVFMGRDPGNTDTEMLIEVWPDKATIAYRSDPWSTWGPPHDLDEVSGAEEKVDE